VCKHNFSREWRLRILSVWALIAKVELFRPLCFTPKWLKPLMVRVCSSQSSESYYVDFCIFCCYLCSTLVPHVISSLLFPWGSAGVWKEGVPKVTPRDFPLSEAAQSDSKAIHYSANIPMKQRFTRRSKHNRILSSLFF